MHSRKFAFFLFTLLSQKGVGKEIISQMVAIGCELITCQVFF